MFKRGKIVVKSLVFFQTSLIILSFFSFTFFINQISLVNGQSPAPASNVPIGTSTHFSNAVFGAGSTLTSGQIVGSTVAVTSPGSPPFNIVATPANPVGYSLAGDGTYTFTHAGKTVTGISPSNIVVDGDTLADLTVEPYKQGLTGITGGVGHLVNGLLTAAAIVGAIQMIGSLIGLDQELTNALSYGAGAGFFLADALASLGPSGFGIVGGDSFFVVNAGWIGFGAGIIIFALLYKSERAQRISFQCLPWEAPVGGKNCEQCNGDKFRPCSEYRCKALGQACEIVNAGTKEEKCVWVNPNDALSPTITPWKEVLTDGHKYSNHDTRPASLGTKIIRESASNGCLKAFTPLTFGVLTNEPAQCKVDLDHKNTYDEMQFFFGNSNLFTYNHSQTFSLPSPNAVNAEAPEFPNDGKYDFFVRCRDKNGNENVDEFAIQFCVDPSPDTTPAVIVDTSITSGSAVRFGVGTVPLQVYVNEPAECKWSTQDKTYETMENPMTCATSLSQINARELYTCSTNLNGIVDRQENTFYFRCKDKPSALENERNVNVNSYVFKLRGSQPLNIIGVAPNGTITGSTQTVPVDLKVTTDDGADEGVAICAFSPTGAQNTFVTMFDTEKVESTQRLTLGTGNYNYQIRCVDLGGNAAQANITFNVLVDTTPPMISRAYHDSSNNALKIVTNEDASCVYSLNSCNYNFNEGVALLYVTPSNKKAHYAEWKPNLIYYLKCKDSFGNEPSPNACSLVASATNIA